MDADGKWNVEDEERFRKDGFIQDDYRDDFVSAICASSTALFKTRPTVQATHVDLYRLLVLAQ